MKPDLHYSSSSAKLRAGPEGAFFFFFFFGGGRGPMLPSAVGAACAAASAASPLGSAAAPPPPPSSAASCMPCSISDLSCRSISLPGCEASAALTWSSCCKSWPRKKTSRRVEASSFHVTDEEPACFPTHTMMPWPSRKRWARYPWQDSLLPAKSARWAARISFMASRRAWPSFQPDQITSRRLPLPALCTPEDRLDHLHVTHGVGDRCGHRCVLANSL